MKSKNLPDNITRLFGNEFGERLETFGFGIFSGAMDDDGRPVSRTKQSHPYNYDTFVSWDDGTGRGKPNSKAKTDGAYHDRMQEWDYDKYKRCAEKAWGKGNRQSFQDVQATEEFLQYYFDKPNLKLVRILEGCNQASGYPVWYFRWTETELTPEMKLKHKNEQSAAEFFEDK